MKQLTIYLDFDGTVVEHMFPNIGKPVPMALEVIRKLCSKNCLIILNTYRIDLLTKYALPENDKSAEKEFEDCLQYFVDNGIKIDSIQKPFKLHPLNWDVNFSGTDIFIDDIAGGIPLIPGTQSIRPMVNWIELDRQFIEKGIY